MIPLSIARYLELELQEIEQPMEVVGRTVDRYKAKIKITLGRGGRFCAPIENVDVSIPKEGKTLILFGRKPIFELYTITFIEAEQRYSMKPYSPESSSSSSRQVSSS